jgi:hypothetical protein
VGVDRLYDNGALLSRGDVAAQWTSAGRGGYNGGALSSAEVYDPASGRWTVTGSLTMARNQPTATLLPNGQVLVEGGVDSSGNYLASAELYTPAISPANATWTATTHQMANGRTLHTATLLPDGQVLVAGGYNGGFLSSAELYDPASEMWAVTSPLITARDLHTATLLPNGKVLVAGGANGGAFLSSSELYDPATGMWTVTGSLNTARDGHTATLLPNGQVLAAGGFNGSSVLPNAEL